MGKKRTIRRPIAIGAILALAGSLSACSAPLTPAAGATAVALPTAAVMRATAVASTRAPTQMPLPTHAPTLTPLPPDAVLVGAGDIANCDPAGAEATARLLDHIDGTVVTLGDHAYPNGTAADFERCYEPTWGRHNVRTRPSPGNHDYLTDNARPYFATFGVNAGPAGRGYYSYNLGAWHIVSLNSQIASSLDSEQATWLRADLAANQATCTLAYWHVAVFSSGVVHGNNDTMKSIWNILTEAGTDVVLTAHEHTYERFAPQNSSAIADPNGIRQFVVGTGGAGLYAFGSIQPNSETRNNQAYGVLKLTLHVDSYNWEFVPVAGSTFRDTGSAPCIRATANS
jgi:hypothetical protein